MSVIGIDVTKMNFERLKSRGNKVNVDHSPSIEEVEETKVNTPSGQVNALRIKFRYEVNFDPKIGQGFLEGNVLFRPEEVKMEDVLERWDEENEIHGSIFMEVINPVIDKVMPSVFSVCNDLNLPSPVPLPRISQDNVKD